MRRILIVTGSRGEWGYIKPVIEAIAARDDVDYGVVATNLHVLPEFGYSIKEMESAGVNITDRIYMSLDGYTPATMAKSQGIFLLGITDTLVRERPDIVLLAGDRGEQLMAAMAASTMNIPVAHIQAGELSGNIDGLTRHAIARFAHIHFAANEDAAERLRRSGEQEFRIHMTGAPQLDGLVNGDYAPSEEVAHALNLDLSRPIVLFVQHSVTEEFEQTAAQVRETLEAVLELGHQTVAIFPNNDAGSGDVRRTLERYKRQNIRIERNLPRRTYAGLLRVADVMVGNSSSALIEAPVFHLPAVNVGNRQKGRYRGRNVIDVHVERKAIHDALLRAMAKEFRQGLVTTQDNPYHGDGQVSKRIVDILATAALDAKLLKKEMAY